MTDDRSTYLGATDIAAVLGLSPYRAPIDVWHEKRGTGPPAEQTPRMRLGQLLEAAVAEAYAEQTGRRLRRVGIIRHPRYPYLAGHPDRLVIGERGVLEVKTSASTAGYDAGDVPPQVRVQAVWYCGLTRREWCDVALLARQEVRVARVEADPELFESLTDAAVEWHARHIVDGAEPEPDGSDGYRAHLAAKYPSSNGAELVATPELSIAAFELHDAAGMAAGYKRAADTIKARLMAAMGEAETLIGPGWRATWREQAGRTDWRRVAGDYRRLLTDSGQGAAALDFIAEMHTAPPARVFRTHFAEESTGVAIR